MPIASLLRLVNDVFAVSAMVMLGSTLRNLMRRHDKPVTSRQLWYPTLILFTAGMVTSNIIHFHQPFNWGLPIFTTASLSAYVTAYQARNLQLREDAQIGH